MRSDIGTEVTGRFFEAIYELKRQQVLHGKGTFTRRYNINRWNLNALESGKGRLTSVTIPWLVHLVRDYAVSAHWLLTGRGAMFTDGFDATIIKSRQDASFGKNGANSLLKEKKNTTKRSTKR